MRRQGHPFEDLCMALIDEVPKFERFNIFSRQSGNISRIMIKFRGWYMFRFGDFEHHFQVSVGDFIPKSWVMFK